MSRPRILQVFSRYLHYGGEEGCFRQIGQAMREIADVDVYEASTEQMLKGGIHKKLLAPFLAVHRPQSVRDLRRLQKEQGYDSWEVHNVFPALSPAVYSTAFKLGVPLVHFLHNYRFGSVNAMLFADGREQTDGLQGNFIPAIRRKEWHGSLAATVVQAAAITRARRLGIFEKVTRWVTTCQKQKEIHIRMGIPEYKIDVIPHFLHLEEDARTLLPFSAGDDGYALFIGRLSPEKGVERLLDAWKMMPAERELRIVGDGPEMARLRAQAERQGLSNVRFLGFIPKEQHTEILGAAMFLAFPTLWQEPFGMVTLEAWAAGRPMVAHRIGSLPDIISPGVDGFLADPRDPASLAAEMEKAFQLGEAGLHAMGQNGYRKLREEYSREKWLERAKLTYQRSGLL